MSFPFIESVETLPWHPLSHAQARYGTVHGITEPWSLMARSSETSAEGSISAGMGEYKAGRLALKRPQPSCCSEQHQKPLSRTRWGGTGTAHCSHFRRTQAY